MTAGRRSKLTPELQDRLCEIIASGCYLETAAAFAGLNRTTIHRWLRKGAERKRGRYWRFRLAIRRALAQAEIRDVLQIRKATEVHWQASAWRLERRYPKRWARTRERTDPSATQPDPEQTAKRIREFLAAAEAMDGGLPTSIEHKEESV